MKKVAIIYNQSLKAVQGINYVNNSFVEGQRYFKDKGFELKSIFAPDGVFECEGKDRLDLIGSNVGTLSYERERRLRSLLREVLSSKYLLGASVKYYFNHIRNAQKAVSRFLKRSSEYDYIIFQDENSAAEYFKCTQKNERLKCILILHCSKEIYEQTRLQFPALFANKYWTKYVDKSTRYVFEEIDKIVYLSQRAVDYSPVHLNKKTYIFNGEEDLKEHILEEVHSPVNFVSVASMAWRKGQELVIEAMAMLPKNRLNKIKYHLIGAGPQMSELEALVTKCNLSNNVIFYGSRNDVPELLKDMDVFILPSKSEGLPMSIIEALRQGMYLVATDTGAIPEMIAQGCGELIERDSAQIAQCMIRILTENVVTLEVKKKAREHYLRNFTLQNMIYHYCDILENL